jgi:VanZ family protein
VSGLPSSVRRFALAAVCAGIWLLSADPALKVLPALFPGQDKLLHLVEYSVFGFVLAANQDLFRGSWLAMSLTGVLWAGLDEVHQAYVPGRDCSSGDFLADCAGMALGFILMSRMRRRGWPTAKKSSYIPQAER